MLPVFNAFGTGRWPQMQAEHLGQIGDGSAVGNLAASIVPADAVRFVLCASALQDSSANKVTKLYLEVPLTLGGSAVKQLVQLAAQPVDAHSAGAVLPRGFYMPPGTNLRAVTALALAAASTFSLDYVFVDLPIGEHVPPA